MITVEEYLTDPCGTLSIPLWKWKRITVPEGMEIIHDSQWTDAVTGSDEPYFRLLHNLKRIPEPFSKQFFLKTADREDFLEICAMINASYENIRVSEVQMEELTLTPVYDGALWVIAVERNSGSYAGCAIADFDPLVGEGILEWIQVLPQYRRRGVGKLLVLELLRRMEGKATFVTVSGKCRNSTNPERLYRRCGFTGTDIWHIVTK